MLNILKFDLTKGYYIHDIILYEHILSSKFHNIQLLSKIKQHKIEAKNKSQ